MFKRRLVVEIVKHVKIVKDKQTDGHMDGQEIIRKAHQKLWFRWDKNTREGRIIHSGILNQYNECSKHWNGIIIMDINCNFQNHTFF